MGQISDILKTADPKEIQGVLSVTSRLSVSWLTEVIAERARRAILKQIVKIKTQTFL